MQQSNDATLRRNQQRMTIPPSLLYGGVPREELHVYLAQGLVIWYPNGEVRAPSMRNINHAMRSPIAAVRFVSLIPR